MRPLRLDLHGFTVFREPTSVDFTDADYFALVGPTGAGKSTVLDAICFALYGTVPRWGDRRRIENALAPSAQEARVRFAFEAAGVRFVATRVVRRDGKGKVTTAHAGLEQLPRGFDLAAFDAAPGDRATADLGIVLAGTPAEMDAAVADAVGLPYEQFTSCVVLPQGEFARFLHAKPAERQEILVNLLGLHVYQRIGERAGVVQREAETKAAATRSLLAELNDADEAALAAAERSLAAARGLVDRVEAELPALADATAAGNAARADLARIDSEIAILDAVRVPAGIDSLGERVSAAHEEAAATATAVHEAEEREEKVRAELAAAGDRSALQRLVDAHGERDRLATRVTELAAVVATAQTQHDRAAKALAAATAKAEKANRAVAAAQAGIEAAQTADRAATLRVHLVEGQPCPVCEQTVHTVPPVPETAALVAARKRLTQAEKAAKLATGAVQEQDLALRELDRGLAAAAAQHDDTAQRLATVEMALAAAPALAALEAELAAIATAERALAGATEAVRVARRAAHAAAERAGAADERLRSAWHEFDRVRDRLAVLGPPPANRDDLLGSWRDLRVWAESAKAERRRQQDSVVSRAEAALATIAERVAHLDSLFERAGVPGARAHGDPAAYRQEAALAVERAAAAHSRILERQAQAARLSDQVAEYAREAQVAKLLALHLRADRFERWLLAEALDALVVGASRILRELSGGQYDLSHHKGDFFVIDHSDAGLRRGVRTLSGGETFQASLALALALSEQLVGLSTSAASLESIMLDEGFGTLDSATLDTVAATLENLAARGDRMVGVVTHVAALAERIPVRFDVSKDSRGVAKIVRSG